MSLVRNSDSGDPKGREKLFVALYDELHRMASRELRRNIAVTIGPTTLLHETFLNVSGRESAEFVDRQKFMAYAARASSRSALLTSSKTRSVPAFRTWEGRIQVSVRDLRFQIPAAISKRFLS